jgi:hypothetical protein
MTHKLVGQKENRLQAKLAVAEVEEVFERRAQKIQDHGIIVALGSKPPDERNANAASKRLVNLRLIFELRVLGLDRFKLDGNLLARDDVDPQVDVTLRKGLSQEQKDSTVQHTERAGTNLLPKPVLSANAKVQPMRR